MWSVFNNTMGHHGHHHSIGQFSPQKRDFSLKVENVPIVPGKIFGNPNFVIQHHPSFCKEKSVSIRTHEKKNNHSDIPDEEAQAQNINCTVKTCSLSTEDIIQKHTQDSNLTSKSVEEPKKVTKQRKRNRRSKQKKSSARNSKQDNPRKIITEMLDIEVEEMDSDIPVSRQISHTFKLTDFLVEKPNKPTDISMNEDDLENDSDEEFMATFVSISPSDITKLNIRDRQMSISESEDSFIIFDSGTNEEMGSSEEESESESEEEEEEADEDVVDFALSIIPRKKVRFAEESDLCEIHTMVQWSFAYQQARKGPWEAYARDRDRFNRRVADTERLLKPIFDATHRRNIYNERFKDDKSVL